ncbi:MAG: TIGR03752 family integrating conjugative element protein, partial [Saezia sp.]
MKSNGLLKWLMIPVVLVFFFLVIKVFSGKSEDASFEDTPRLTAEEMKALGIEGDSPRDTLATLVGQVKQLRTELQDTKLSYQEQKTDNERLRARESGLDQRIESALRTERQNLQQEQERNRSERQQTTSMLSDLQRRLEGVNNRVELPVGLGLDDGGQIPIESFQWVEPLDAKPQERRSTSLTGPTFATSFSADDPRDRSLHAGERIRHENYADKANTVKPVYTIPANATLMGSVAMTALIGRVPVDGTVNDPYPFKVLVGS